MRDATSPKNQPAAPLPFGVTGWPLRLRGFPPFAQVAFVHVAVLEHFVREFAAQSAALKRQRVSTALDAGWHFAEELDDDGQARAHGRRNDGVKLGLEGLRCQQERVVLLVGCARLGVAELQRKFAASCQLDEEGRGCVPVVRGDVADEEAVVELCWFH